MKLIGPFRQIVTMNNLPLKGAISDDRLEIVPEGVILIHGSSIFEVEKYSYLEEKYADLITSQEIFTSGLVAFPGFVDPIPILVGRLKGRGLFKKV
jgi:imidazolonepropionase